MNELLGTELEDAELWVSKAAHRHIALDHPDDYKIVLPRLAYVISDPSYVGQKPGNPDNFYLVRKFGGVEGAVLVAVGVERNKFGTYNVRSSYLISEADVQRYKEAGHLWIV